MSVYVSPYQGAAFEGDYLLFADSDQELHVFARRLGLKRKWASRQSPITYDLTHFGRYKAVEAGAVELSPEEFSAKIQALPGPSLTGRMKNS